MAKLTIRDIARLAGLSKSTVSLVLNDSPRVDPETRAKVRRVMAEHNYVPSVAATALAKGGSPFIGMIVPGLSWRMVASINYGVASAVEPTRYEIILYTSTTDSDYRGVVDRILGSHLASGILVVTHDHPVEPLVELSSQGTPVVLVNTLGSHVDLPSVESDSYGGARSAVRHLIDLGHVRIACIEGPPQYPCCVERNAGYVDALIEAGIGIEPDLTRPGRFRPDEARKHAVELLRGEDRPTAIFTHNDPMAFAVLEAATECGLRVPADVSVVGFDDIVSSSHVRPALTTIRQPFEEMGQQAAEMLLAALTDGAEPATHVRMPTELVIRDSSGPPPGAGPELTDAVSAADPREPTGQAPHT